MKNARKKKKKEAERMRELSKKRISELTQEAAQVRAKEKKDLEGVHKEVMKKGKKAYKGSKAKRTGEKSEKKDRDKGETQTEKIKDRNKKKQTERLARVKGKKKTAEVQPARGKRKVPEAGDKHGCSHHGLLELLPLPKAYLELYVRVGGWLHGKPCKDCAEKGIDEKERVMDVSALLELKGKKDMGYYCNSGPAGHKMGEDEEWRHNWRCDLILCMDCYARHMTTMGNCKRSKRRNQIV
jgi:hypothetical protein